MLFKPPIVLILTLVISDISSIKVKNWSDSAVNNGFYEDILLPQQSRTENHRALKPIPLEYFQYAAKKPQFAVDIATFHGVLNPQSHYKAYPIRPYNGLERPNLGRHKILDQSKKTFHPFQRYTQENAGLNISPVSSNYEVFHPYKAEEEGLKSIYKDPVQDKIKNDIRSSQYRLHKYEQEAGKPDIKDEDNLEKFEDTDRKKVPQKSVLTPYEVHTPLRRPVYYQPPAAPLLFKNRENVLNHKFKHPLHQDYAKIKPVHYQPIKQYIAKLKQHQGLKYDDTRNQYPQLQSPLKYTQPDDGYEIFERGKANYIKLRNNIDESVSKVKQENNPPVYPNLELQNNNGKVQELGENDKLEKESNESDEEEEEEFVPVKNYAQVRKTETMKLVPRSSAFEDAESYDEEVNAPRLREAIKSTKAQTVYTEEGYEDAAYDHAGEQKHADENEGHGGHLKEKEISGGKYKIPSVKTNYEDGQGKEYGDEKLEGKEWKNENKELEAESDEEDYTEHEDDGSIESDIYEDVNASVERSKREKLTHNSTENITEIYHIDQSTEPSSNHEVLFDLSNSSATIETLAEINNFNNSNSTVEKGQEHGVNKRETKFKVPQINITSTFLTEEELRELGKIKDQPKQVDIKDKYPYYFKNLRSLNRNSPLRYAENLKFIPHKSKGGSEFYDSRSLFECPEVDDDVAAIPEKLSEGENPEESDIGKNSKNSKQLKKEHRLKGLGDKIDCFKAKFFGSNPLDSPFFKEDIILNPEPVTMPNKAAYKLIKREEPSISESKLNDAYSNSEKLELKNQSKLNVSDLFEQLKNSQKNLQESLVKTNEQLRSSLSNISPLNISRIEKTKWPQQADIYTDVLGNIKNNIQNPKNGQPSQTLKLYSDTSEIKKPTNVTYNFYHNKEDITKPSVNLRKKRATHFVYEPYKIIHDVQLQDSKKTTTSSNISPLIKQLQLSKVIDTFTKTYEKDQPVKRNVKLQHEKDHIKKINNTSKVYKDIGRKEREKPKGEDNIDRKEREKLKGDDTSDDKFVDVNVDRRRGEPRYELRPSNHRLRYSPVANKTEMSIDEYMAQKNKTILDDNKSNSTKVNDDQIIMDIQRNSRQRLRQATSSTSTTVSPIYDITKYLPKLEETQKISQYVPKVEEIQKSASNTVRRVIRTTTQSGEIKQNNDFDTTTAKLLIKRRTRPTTTSTTTIPEENPLQDSQNDENVTRYPKLRLITRFKSTTPTPIMALREETTTEREKQEPKSTIEAPNYSEKKKKSTKSTIIQDTKSYGDDDGDMMKEEVDEMIGVKQDMREYMPNYEKENDENDKANYENDKENLSSDSHENDYDSDEDNDYYDEESEEDDDEEEEKNKEDVKDNEPEQTTSEPIRRTLPLTTVAPISTTEKRKEKLEIKPVVFLKKKIELHKEVPKANAPNVTLFKQNIKEIEIVKQVPTPSRIKKPQKNIEALELYKDDNLAKEVNKLGEVEIFKENLNLRTGPRHGGNYRIAKFQDIISTTETPERLERPERPQKQHRPERPDRPKRPERPERQDRPERPEIPTRAEGPIRIRNSKAHKNDAVALQSEINKNIQTETSPMTTRTDKKFQTEINPITRRSDDTEIQSEAPKFRTRGRNISRQPETVDNVEKTSSEITQRGNHRLRNSEITRKNSKLIEIGSEEEEHDDIELPMHGGNFKLNSNPRQNQENLEGKYRNARIQATDSITTNTDDDLHRKTKSRGKDARENAAIVLNSFAQVVPILTTTPAYILDPSKRRYYYVDA